jgi:O-antigen/teichoic acid export membrane protein
VIPFLFGQSFKPAVLPAQILFVGAPATAGLTVLSALLILRGLEREQTTAYVVGVALNLGAIVAFSISGAGALGLAAATVIGAVGGLIVGSVLMRVRERQGS